MRIWIPLIHTFTNSFSCDIKVYVLFLSYILFCLKSEDIPLFFTDSINFKKKLFAREKCLYSKFVRLAVIVRMICYG